MELHTVHSPSPEEVLIPRIIAPPDPFNVIVHFTHPVHSLIYPDEGVIREVGQIIESLDEME